jgi:hypothetical protein
MAPPPWPWPWRCPRQPTAAHVSPLQPAVARLDPPWPVWPVWPVARSYATAHIKACFFSLFRIAASLSYKQKEMHPGDTENSKAPTINPLSTLNRPPSGAGTALCSKHKSTKRKVELRVEPEDWQRWLQLRGRKLEQNSSLGSSCHRPSHAGCELMKLMELF